MKMVFVVAVLSAFVFPAAAGAACYETRLMEGPLTCGGGQGGKSADFTGSCSRQQQYVNVEVACPTPAPAATCGTNGTQCGMICGVRGAPACPKNYDINRN